MSGTSTRVVVLFALAALLPAALTALVWLGVSTWGDRPSDGEVLLARRVFEDETERRKTAVDTLCRDDLVVDRLLAARAEGSPVELDYDRLLGGSMQAAGLDVLWVLDSETADVVAMGHARSRVGDRQPGLLQAAAAAGDKPFLFGADGSRKTVLQPCAIGRSGTNVTIVGGHWTESLRALDRDHLFLVERPAPDEAVVGLLHGPDGTPEASLVWRSGIGDGTPPLLLWLGSVALLTLGLALLLGGYFNRWIQSSVDELAEAATRIGAGDLSATVLSTRSDAFQATATAFNRMTRDLQQAQEQLRQTERVAAWQDIARRLAHELKNPLSPIRLSIETLRKAHDRRHEDFEALFDESTKTILQEVERLRRIIDEFSRFARLPSPTLQDTDLREIVPQAVSLYSRDEAVTVQAELPGHPVHARVDVEQVTQVLHNLVQNARDAALEAHPDGTGTVRVTLEDTGSDVRIRIEDDGPGITSDRIERIFDPYVTDKQGGTGLGLSISNRIVSEHGGRIEVDSRPGKTAFVVVLPR